ncbi:MAG: hypothetical protein N2511_08705, partial [Thermodesulfovibrionales bacterium]|nr:hypothetical protein [Thermodesulfovibrionales bacterium]
IEERSDRIFIIDYKTSSKKENYKINIDKLSEIIDNYKYQIKLDKTSYFTYLIGNNISSLQMPIYLLGFSKAKNVSLDKLVGLYLL